MKEDAAKNIEGVALMTCINELKLLLNELFQEDNKCQRAEAKIILSEQLDILISNYMRLEK